LNGGGSAATVTLNLDDDIDLTSVTADLYGATHITVKNTSGGTLAKGAAVYATGSVGASGAVEVQASDADNASTMPALGLLDDQLANNTEGSATILGIIKLVDTSAYSVNDELYVSTTPGALTSTRPTGASELVQKIGRVVRSDASTGEILVLGAGRTNDVPNGTLSNDISGNAATATSATSATTATNLSGGSVAATTLTASGDANFDSGTLFVDASTNRVGIGTTTPATALHLFAGGNTVDQLRISSTGGTLSEYGFAAPDASTNSIRWGYWTGSGFGNNHFEGNVGIGTASPGAPLDIVKTGTGSWQRGIRILNSGMASGDELLVSAGLSDSARNIGQMYFHYNSSGSTSNRLSFGLHSQDDVLNITGGGNVGIGDTTPSYKLDVAGEIRATSNVRANAFLMGTSDDGLGPVTGQYGSVQTRGTGAGNWEGYSINGQQVFMGNGTETCGIYNDVDNQWLIYFDADTYTQIYDSDGIVAFGANNYTTGGTGSAGNGYVGVSTYCGGFSGTTAVMSTQTVAGVSMKRLGFSASSYEFKSGIEDLAMSDEAFMSLRPITFHPNGQYVDSTGEVTEIVGGHTIVPDNTEAGETDGLMPLRRAGFGLEDLYGRDDTMILASEFSPDPMAMVALLTQKLQETMTRVSALESGS